MVATAPTVGANQELFQYKNLLIRMYDLGGQTALRASWSSYFAKARAIIMVVDSTDRERLGLAREELHRVARDPELTAGQAGQGACLLVFANKQDVKGCARLGRVMRGLANVPGVRCMTPAQVSEGLALTDLRDRTYCSPSLIA